MPDTGAFQARVQRTPLGEIKVRREGRQRRELDPEKIKLLAESIERVGLIHPIVLDKDMNLVAGEMRLEAHRLLGRETILTRLNTSLDPQELEIIELEENLKRTDLTWQDQVRAVGRVHQSYCTLDPSWTEEKTAEVISMDRSSVAQFLSLNREFDKGNKAVMEAGKRSEAMTTMKRARGRAREEVLKTIFDEPKAQGEAEEAQEGGPPPEVLCADFLEWAPSYRGEKFSFIHCDFPYGVGMDKSGQVSKALGAYADSQDVYFRLLGSFVSNFSNFAYPASHIMFWFSMDFFTETVELLSEIPDSRVFRKPLVWHKSDGKGIVSDALRRPRHTYETALMVEVGGRQIRKVVNDSVALPTDETRGHVSRKPPSVLSYFLPMFLAEGDRMLDPTCGSGSALEVAKGLGAEVLGLELNPEFVAGIKL